MVDSLLISINLENSTSKQRYFTVIMFERERPYGVACYFLEYFLCMIGSGKEER